MTRRDASSKLVRVASAGRGARSGWACTCLLERVGGWGVVILAATDHPRRRMLKEPSALPAGHPEDVAVLAIGVAGEDEEQVREAVEVGDRQDVHGVLVLAPRRPPGPLGTTYDGARDVEVGRRGRPAVQDE